MRKEIIQQVSHKILFYSTLQISSNIINYTTLKHYLQYKLSITSFLNNKRQDLSWAERCVVSDTTALKVADTLRHWEDLSQSKLRLGVGTRIEWIAILGYIEIEFRAHDRSFLLVPGNRDKQLKRIGGDRLLRPN